MQKSTPIIHNGATLNWVASYSDLHKTNINSTVQLLKVAIESTVFPKYVYISGGLKKRASETQEEFAAKLLSWAGYLQTKVCCRERDPRNCFKFAGSSEPHVDT